MPFKIEFKPSAYRAFSRLPREVQRSLKPRIDRLAHNPFPPQSEKLSGPKNLHRLRAGDYRVLYQVREKILLVLVIRSGHRKDVYRRLRK